VGLDGRSFAPILKGEAQHDREFVVKVYNENSGRSRDPMRAIQTKRYLYLFNPWSNGERVMATATSGTPTYRRLHELAKTDSALAARDTLYRHRVVEELYCVADDPDCLHNLINDEELKPVADELRLLLANWMEKTKDHILPAFLDRDDAEKREAYVRAKEAEAERRRPKRRRRNRK
jgi:N-sulfoglucosamine sulfohydrolase